MEQDKSRYGVVYTGSTPPSISENERGMQPIAVRVDLDNETTPLAPTSRINYGNLYTIEHNFKVKPYGVVSRASAAPLMSQFQQVNAQRFGFATQPLPTLREERVPNASPNVPSQGTRRSTNTADARNFLPAQYQQAVARHPVTPAGNTANAQPSRPNAPNVARPMQPNTSAGRPTEPPGFVDGLRQRGFTETQIQAIRGWIEQGKTPQYAMNKSRAMRELHCAPQFGDSIAQAIQQGMSYETAIAQFHARFGSSPGN